MELKKLGFGLMRLPLTDKDDPASIDIDEAMKMTDAFIENGFLYFDTAYMYHNYESEKATKKFLTSRYPRESYMLTSKLPSNEFFLKTEADNERIFNEQLEKTGAGYFDNYLYHSLTAKSYENMKKLNSFDFVKRMMDEGKIKNFALSFHDTAEVLDRILTEHPEVGIVQLQINYMDWDSPSIQSRECYETAVKHGRKVVVMEPVKGGLLANIPEEAEKLMRDYNPTASPASWAIRYAASLEHVYMVLSGMSNLKEIEDNISYMKNFQPLNKEEYAIIEQVTEIIKSKIEIACTACEYCVEGCPQNIPIPDYFELYNNKKAYHSENEDSYNSMTEKKGKASECIECGQCESICPQKLHIIDHLKSVARVYE